MAGAHPTEAEARREYERIWIKLGRRRCIGEGATAALDVTIAVRNRRVSLLLRSFPCGILGFRIP